MRFSKFSEFQKVAKDLGYGHIEDITFDIEEGDPELQRATRDPRLSMYQFANFLRRKNGSATFQILKVQDGLPMYGEAQIGEGIIQSYRFHIKNK